MDEIFRFPYVLSFTFWYIPSGTGPLVPNYCSFFLRGTSDSETESYNVLNIRMGCLVRLWMGCLVRLEVVRPCSDLFIEGLAWAVCGAELPDITVATKDVS